MESKFSVIVPLFNEEENINPLVASILAAAGTDSRLLEVVLVDDGSGDATWAKALNLAACDKRIRPVRHDCNKGLGAAIQTGLLAAEGDFVLYTDADLPFDFRLIPQLFSLADESCIVAGYRLNRGEGGRRLVLTKVYNALIWLLFGLYMRDVNFACKIFPRRFLQNAKFESFGSFIDVEILLEARRFGLKILEFPLVYSPRERGLSTLSRPGVILVILKEMFAYASRKFANKTAFFSFIKFSPIVKFTIYSAVVVILTVPFMQSAVTLDDATAWWLLPALGTGIISLLLGWREGLLAAIAAAFAAESVLIWQHQSFFSPAFFPFLICAFLGIVLARFSYRSWRFVQKSRNLITPE